MTETEKAIKELFEQAERQVESQAQRQSRAAEGCRNGLLALAIVPLNFVWFGWVTMTIWNWFLPQMLGAPKLTLASAIAIDIVYQCIAARLPTKEDRERKVGEILAHVIVHPAVLLFFAWVLKLCTQ